MHVPQLKEWLKAHDVQPQKSLGQHFLCHEPTLEIISACVTGDKVLEIGPGPGCLTQYLAQVPGRDVTVVEKDLKFQDLMTERFPLVHWVNMDALHLNWANYAGFFIASNLPYNISVPLMLQYTQQAHLFHGAVFMMQKEVADRVMAVPRTKDYGRLSVMMQTYLDITWVADVPPSAFWPKPSVDSTVLLFKAKQPWPAVSFKPLSSLVARAFASRRQMLHRNISLDRDVWVQSEIDSRRRAETLNPEEFLKLLKTMAEHSHRQHAEGSYVESP